MKLPFLYLVLLLTISCGKENNEPLDPADNSDLEWTYGGNDFNITIDDTLRNFVIHVPDAYDGQQSVPLLFMLHGSSGNGQKFYNISGWVEKSNENNFIAVFPTGLEYPIIESGKNTTKWSTSNLSEEIPQGHTIKDDEVFIREIIRMCSNSLNIDKTRIYACGFSNGGNFTRNNILPHMSDIFAAVAISGGFGVPEKLEVDGDKFLPLYAMIGTKDDKIIENTGVFEEINLDGQEFMSHELYGQYARAMAETIGLTDEFTENQNPPKYNILTFDKSAVGQNNEYKIMLINEMDHIFANGNNNPKGVKATDHLWPWFMKFSL